MMAIKLTQDKVTIVSDEDYEAVVLRGKWCVVKQQSSGDFYALRNDWYKHNSGKWKTIRVALHKFIAERFLGTVHDGMVVDHINHDTLDNTRDNLRICTFTQGQQNRRKIKQGTSLYKGVTKNSNCSTFRCKITVNKHVIQLGNFLDEIDAARAYNAAAVKYFGEYACLNVIDEK